MRKKLSTATLRLSFYHSEGCATKPCGNCAFALLSLISPNIQMSRAAPKQQISPSQGHSRRDNASGSSTGSLGKSERGGSRTSPHVIPVYSFSLPLCSCTLKPAVESAVTRLLVSIKQLLEALTQWSTLKLDENDVSDVYVRLGNDFNAAVAAFGAFGIDMAYVPSLFILYLQHRWLTWSLLQRTHDCPG